MVTYSKCCGDAAQSKFRSKSRGSAMARNSRKRMLRFALTTAALRVGVKENKASRTRWPRVSTRSNRHEPERQQPRWHSQGTMRLVAVRDLGNPLAGLMEPFIQRRVSREPKVTFLFFASFAIGWCSIGICAGAEGNVDSTQCDQPPLCKSLVG